MKNRFYTEFDEKTLGTRSNDPHRTPFQRDRDRIVHGPAFRRLQGKTQVFLTGEYDFYRTRLTHSIEVAQFGRSICNVLRRNKNGLKEDFYIDAELVEAACLAHDLGNPPFGHAGEETLHQIMEPYGGFEGNAQCLRLVTEMFYGTMGKKEGMKPTRAFVDAILKYTVIYNKYRKLPPKKFLYPEQDRQLDFVFEGFDWRARAAGKLPRSIECQIMNLADDIAYSIDDVKDATIAGFITPATIIKWMDARSDLTPNDKDWLDRLKKSIERGDFDSHLSTRMGEFIRGVSLEPGTDIMNDRTNRYKFNLKFDRKVKEECEVYKKLAFEVVFKTAKIEQLDLKADYILRKLFNSLDVNYSGKRILHLLPEDWHNYIRNQKARANRARTICDFIAGMTDGFAGRAFQRLFLPEYGSLTDLV